LLVCQTPLRISFFGGGTDIPEYYITAPDGGQVISAAIDKSTYVILNRLYRDQFVCNYTKKESVSYVEEIEHEYIREVLRHFNVNPGLEITTLADIPSEGSGLASSSSILVGLINAISTWIGAPMNQDDIAHLACHIELEILDKPIGKQDQFAVSYGGFNHFRFFKDGSVKIEKILYDTEFERKFVLVNTGQHRQSSSILTSQKNSIEKKLKKYNKIYDICTKALDYYNLRQYDDFGIAMSESMNIKNTLAKGITNDAINAIMQNSVSWATGCKICGAGGGGYILFMTDHAKEIHMKNRTLDTFDVGFDNQGTRIVFYNEK
jgi:D-glycero-alpha-D-manno-heptose-7-phosphate kinase